MHTVLLEHYIFSELSSSNLFWHHMMVNCGLYYKRVTIVIDTPSVISK
jgi:hypothetical protein